MADSIPLFRPEALEAQKTRWLGDIQLAQPFPLWLLAVAAATVALAIVLFLTFAQHTKRATVGGRLVPAQGQIPLVAAQGGRIQRVAVTEGQSVQAGEVLFVISLERESERATHEGALAEALAARRAAIDAERGQQVALAQLDGERLRARQRALEAERAQLDRELATVQARLALAERNAERFRSLAAQGFMSSVGAQGKEEEVLDLRARVQATERARLGIERELANLASELASLPLRAQAALAGAARQQALLAQEGAELAGRRTLAVRAPVAGTVSAVALAAGQWAQPGQVLAQVLPEGSELVAELYAPSHAVGFVAPGQTVWARITAFPYQKFGQPRGEVIEVSKSPIAPRDLPAGVAPAGWSEPLWRVRVRLDRQSISAYGQAQPLAAGMQLEADVELDRRRLIEWIFEPLLSLKGRLAGG